jgi:hypothetical protein
MLRLLQRRTDIAKGRAELRTNAIHGGNDRDRDACGNEAVFDSGGTGLIFKERQNERLHGGSDPRFSCLEQQLARRSYPETYGEKSKVALTAHVELFGILQSKFR